MRRQRSITWHPLKCMDFHWLLWSAKQRSSVTGPRGSVLWCGVVHMEKVVELLSSWLRGTPAYCYSKPQKIHTHDSSATSLWLTSWLSKKFCDRYKMSFWVLLRDYSLECVDGRCLRNDETCNQVPACSSLCIIFLHHQSYHFITKESSTNVNYPETKPALHTSQ